MKQVEVHDMRVPPVNAAPSALAGFELFEKIHTPGCLTTERTHRIAIGLYYNT